jgi:4-amino-4-deoxy-L-arabinose transferase-like glycosyltransferase
LPRKKRRARAERGEAAKPQDPRPASPTRAPSPRAEANTGRSAFRAGAWTTPDDAERGDDQRGFRARAWTALAALALLSLHYGLAARSLVQENPTVDEVVHLPAGVTYWQKGTFRLYHHNPPLVKLVAALPVVLAGPETEPAYRTPSWRSNDPSPPTFSQEFAYLNASRYFELFQLARLAMPLFSVVGGVVVFLWSRRLYGVWGGLLSLSLWVLCPNVLAHARLVTTDMGSTALGVAATYFFWRYLERPGWSRAAAAGVALGFAQLTKFSMLLLYGVWPFFWLLWLVLKVAKTQRRAAIPRALAHAIAIVAISIVTIDAGYFFEGVGIPLGAFEVGSGSLTRPVSPGMTRPRSTNPALDLTWRFRVNRLRGTWLGHVPCPLPEHYVLGFDEQKIEAEGIPRRFRAAMAAHALAPADADSKPADAAARGDRLASAPSATESSDETSEGYPVYLNGVLRRTGWWYYYLLALAYKVPEGTWILVLLSIGVGAFARPKYWNRADEIVLWTVPAVVLFAMSFLTDINLGLRYVLPIAPYVFIATGKLAPWVLGRAGTRKWLAAGIVVGSLGLTAAAIASIHPSYLAYFNWASGGPDRDPARLVDSNLDWGQDLITLRRWCHANIPGQPIGLAYFGQINPSIFALRGEPFDWFLPPVEPLSTSPLPPVTDPRLIGPAPKLKPGYYAVSVTLLNGIPWRLYDPARPDQVRQAQAPVWNAHEFNAFAYFWQFEPIKKIGHSIYVYRITEEDIARVDLKLAKRSRAPHRAQP